MNRWIVFTYGLLSYTIFFVSFLYFYCFVGNFVVPRTMDSTPTSPRWMACLVNTLLVLVFAFQHSVMARPAFKKWLTQWIPSAAERSTYVLATSLALILLFACWQPMGVVIWNIENSVARMMLYGWYTVGWLIVLGTTFLINHFDLFGLRQVWFCLRGRTYEPLKFTTPGPYRVVRHPLYVGLLIAFWTTPTMTLTHLLFALLNTVYILIGIRLEERDLTDAHSEYREYRQRVPALIPRIAKAKRTKEQLDMDAAQGYLAESID